VISLTLAEILLKVTLNTITLILTLYMACIQNNANLHTKKITYGSWIYNYLCNQCLSPLKLWVQISLRRGVLHTTLSSSVTCARSMVFSGYSGFLLANLHTKKIKTLNVLDEIPIGESTSLPVFHQYFLALLYTRLKCTSRLYISSRSETYHWVCN
jgi:hypothetical protein